MCARSQATMIDMNASSEDFSRGIEKHHVDYGLGTLRSGRGIREVHGENRHCLAASISKICPDNANTVGLPAPATPLS